MKKEDISYNQQILATIIYKDDIGHGIHFYTPDSNSLQVGCHYHAQGEIIRPHKHIPVKIIRNEPLQEVLYIESGKLEISFYTENDGLLTTRVLGTGDIVLIQKGGHGFKFLEETKMVEIKQGPFILESKKPLEVKESS